MEEADALADRAGIMARRMLALGTADQLRKRHGDAYHVHLVHKDAPHTSDEQMNEIKDFIHRTFPGATTEERVFHGQLRFSVPNDPTDAYESGNEKHVEPEKKDAIASVIPSYASGGSSISALFSQLEANKEKLGFEYYSVSQATLDQVFLSIVTKHNVLEENYAREHRQKEGFGTKIKRAFGKDSWSGLLCGF
jgi:ABC-type multidrug transport system ATPase subunit